MRKVLTLACLLAVAHHVAPQCSNSLTYSETLIPECAPKDIYIKWPNYENSASYFQCNGVNNPVEVQCPPNQYFCYVLQECVFCNNYLPPVQCNQLKTQNPPNCVPIGQGGSTGATTPGSTYPTPIYPGTSSTTKITTTKTTAEPTTKTTKATVSTNPTPPTEGPGTPGTTSNIPPPPSPVTNDPNIPMPPTPEPTPPPINVTPPFIPAPPSAG